MKKKNEKNQWKKSMKKINEKNQWKKSRKKINEKNMKKIYEKNQWKKSRKKINEKNQWKKHIFQDFTHEFISDPEAFGFIQPFIFLEYFFSWIDDVEGCMKFLFIFSFIFLHFHHFPYRESFAKTRVFMAHKPLILWRNYDENSRIYERKYHAKDWRRLSGIS